MRKTNFEKKKIIASILCANMMLMSMPLNTLASEITGITPNGNTYNIEAAKVSGSTGFRHYDKFDLSKGDIANLVYKNDYSKFVNLVNEQIKINGLVQTLKDNSFYNGHAIFVSPNGMIVGASGVLNVGSLSILTPSQNSFNSFKTNYENGNLSSYEYGADKYKGLITDSQGNIVINGKILAREEVNLYGSDIKIGDGTNRAGIIAGANNTKYENSDAAKSVFDSLVSNNITDTDGFALSNGKIQIVANKQSKFADAAGNINANVDIKKSDLGANEINISSKAEVDRQERIDLAEAKVNVEDSNITGDTISITAKSTQHKKVNSANILDDAEFIGNTLVDIFSGETPSITSLWGVAGKAVADVTIKNSTITANKATDSSSQTPDLSVLIHAEASSETSENANLLTPTIIDLIKSDDAKIGEFFSSGLYNGFEGAKSSANVNIENSTINANTDNTKNVEISTEASSTLDANNRVLALFMPVGLYGVGTETVSKAVVTGSTLNVTKGDVDINAVSSNSNAVNLTNDSLLSYTLEDALLAMILNNTVKSETEASVISSTVKANNLTVLATNLSESESEIGMEARANKNGEGRGNSAVSAVGILNRSSNNVTALIKDSTVETEESTTVLAQSLNITKNTADAAVDDLGTNDPKTFDQAIKNKLKDINNKYLNKNLFDMIKGKTDVRPTESPLLEGGGTLVWNNTNNTTNAKIENSTVNAGDVTVGANTVDLIANSATTDASDTSGEGNFGIGLAVIYNEQHNTTNAKISGSTIEADNVTVDATTELPMNQGKLTFGLNLPFKICGVEKIQFGGAFASEANGKWSVSPVYPKPEIGEDESNFELTGIAEQNIRDTYSGLKPKFRVGGFFNNYAHSEAKGGNTAVSGTVIYNEVVNNTTAEIVDGSNITINPAENDNTQNSLTVNAVNSVIGYNAAGMVEFLVNKINYKIPGQADEEYVPNIEAGAFGLGANLLWDNYTNNATAKIDNSSVDAQKGAINVDSATEQSYMSITMTGAKSEKFGIDGSINIQKLKGDTLAAISNITGDNSVTAKDISINAGKAHVKTTGGKVKRDDDTNQIKWKEQNASASGDEKYIREANDEITNIIAQGAWISQYQEVDNTVQENSQGVAVGASVNITEIDRNVKATIDNAIIDSSDTLTVNSDTYNQKIDVEIAAAFSGGVTQKEAEVEDVQQNANDAQDDENIFGNLFDGEDEYMRNPVGNDLTALQSQFSMSLAGAVDITTDNTNVESSIKNSQDINVGNTLTVNSNRESKNITIGGTVAKSKKVGAGAAVNIYKQEGSVKSYIDGSTIAFSGENPELKMDANNKNWILNIGIGAGAAVNTAAEGKGFQAAVGGSASINTLKPTIEAYINNSTISMDEGKSGSIATSINAKSDVDIYNIAGGGSLVYGAQNGVSAGAALNYNNIKNEISTYIKDSTLEDIGKLTILSDADNDLSDWAIAGAIVAGTNGGAFSFAGGADIDYIHDTIGSKIIKSNITAGGNIEVKANSQSDNLGVAGTFDVTTAQSGVGVNGDVVVNVYRNDIIAEIDKDSNILKAKDVKVSATSTEKSNVIPVGLSVATNEQLLIAAANVGVNVIDNTVKAYASGNIGSGDDAQKINKLTVSAYDETTLYSRGGTLALASADAVVNIAGSVNVDKIDKTVEAKIKDADVKANGDVSVLATSINSLGGTKDENNQYTRDDVTTDTYRDKMLTKNENGDYDGLSLNNSFQNWNMFYDLAVGSNISVGGAGIGKVIENTVTAEVSASTVESNTLSIASSDYSVKNIIAGSIAASAKAAAGLQAIYTRDNSTTNALITNGSNLTIADKIEMLANNKKDSYEILIAGSGAGKGVINANVVLNNVTDKATAKIDNSSTDNEIKAGTLKISADENINSSHIIVTAGGASNLALSVSPTINNYDMTTQSIISATTIKDASIDMNAQSKLGTLDISAGVAGVGQGVSGVGNAIKNSYTNKVKSYIDGATIDTEKAININGNSIIDANNWLATVAVAGQGVSIPVNVLLNYVNSELEAGIKNSKIENAGAITINTNKDKEDVLKNNAIIIGFAGQGVNASVNVIKNEYTNTVSSYVDNTQSTKIDSIDVNAYSKRNTNNINVGIGFTGEGANLMANAVVNELKSTTRSYVDAKSKTLNITNGLNLEAKDTVAARNSLATGKGAGLGVAAGADINLYYSDNLAKTEILSGDSGQINAGSAALNSELLNATNDVSGSVSFGLAAIPVDVQIVEIGKRTGTYSTVEQNYINKAKEMMPDDLKNTASTPSANIKTGAISTINGNLKTTNNISINADSKLKGLDKDGNLVDKFKFEKVDVTAAGATIGVAIKNIQLANNTVSEIAGGKVESSGGNVSLNSKSGADVELVYREVEVSGARASGGSVVYNNTAETLAQVKDATVNANDIEINSKSTNKSFVDATNVVVTGADIVTVDLAEVKDTNKTSAIITGNTNIDAKGKLTLHSTTNTDVTSDRLTIPVRAASLVDVTRNEANVNTITRALIENVNGEINAQNLDIITDYDKMSVFSKSNVVAVSAASLAAYNDCGSYMNADFKSGIDSPSALTLNVADTTNITTAKDNGTEGLISKGRMHGVDVDIAGLYEGAFSKAENDAKSVTVLNVKNHTSNNLNINQYLKSTAEAIANNTKVSGLGVAAIAADSKDTSTMTLDISGTNTITQNAVINATHNSNTISDLSGFSFGLLVSGARLRIDSDMESNTTGNIGGNFNVGNAKITFDTIRNSTLSKSSGSGGFINVSNPEAINNLTGTSVLNIKDITSDDKKGINNWSISNKSTNTFDVTTSNGSGGFINVAVDNLKLTFDTSTNTNIENSNINSTSLIKFDVENNGIVKDTATNIGGGFIAVSTNDVKNNYKSGAKLSLKNTNVKAKDIDLKTSSDLRTKDTDFVEYAGAAGGFVAVQDLDLKNTLTQNSEIDIQNSILEVTKDVKLQALTSSFFKQKIESNGYGFVSVPRAYNNLEVTNNNKITLDNKTKIKASDELDVSFNSNNTLAVRTVSDARNFEGKPSAYANLYFTVNNTLDNSGSMEAGNLVDINFMNNSINTLTQYAHSECHAAVASTNEGTELKRTINNTLNVNSNADITSGKDVEITYSSGKNNVSSTVSWKTVSYALFGIPISDSDSYSVDKPVDNYVLKNNGKIVAGQGNNKYMKINRDGSIDKETLKGFYDDDYILSDGEIISGEIIKQRTLDSIRIEINNIDESLTEISQKITSLNRTIDDYEDKIDVVQLKIDEINNLINNGAILTNDKQDAQGNSDFNTIIQNDIKALIVSDSDDTKITETQYNAIMTSYNTKLAEIETQNTTIFNHNAEPENIDNQQPYIEVPTITEFIETQNYGLSDAQKTTISNGYDSVHNNVSMTEKCGFSVYQNSTGKYVAVTTPTGTGNAQTCEELTQFNNAIEDINAQMEPYQDERTSALNTQAMLQANRVSLTSKYNDVYNTASSAYDQHSGSYSITFNDIEPKEAHISVDGAYNNNISGNGIFSVASNGLKVDNYSTRTLLFNDLNIDSVANKSGLIIGGKNHSEFADKAQAVSGAQAYLYVHNKPGHTSFDNLPTSGVHYKSDGSGISGITINNYYDVNHPFASTFDITEPTTRSDIYIIGSVNTSGDLNIWNESGGIMIANDSGINSGKMSLVSTNNAVAWLMYNETSTTPINIKTNDYIFAQNGFSILTNKDVNIQGTIETGYSNRNITITEDMIKPENLIYDPTSGETNLINLGGDKVSFYLNDTNNIKAIYKDGQIYLYNLPEDITDPLVSISDVNVSLSGKVKMANGLQNITIDNKTNAQLNVANIYNKQFRGSIIPENTTAADGGEIIVNTVDHATTNITSNGKLSLNGVIKNSITTNYNDFPKEKGILNITANNGLEVKPQTKLIDHIPTTVDSILSHGKTTITLNNGQGDIDGKITTTGELNISNKGTGALNLNSNISNDASRNVYPETLISEGIINISNEGTGTLNIFGDIDETEGDIKVQSNAQTNITGSIYDKKGNIDITSKGLQSSNESKIVTDEGDITITNNDSNLDLKGYISSESGNVSIQNNGTSASIAGFISDNKGDLTIRNTKGDMTISSIILHNSTNRNAEGMISIINDPTGGKLDIQNKIQTWGKGRTQQDKTTAILIDNQSAANGMSISNEVTARIGDIIIKNAVDELSISGNVTDGNGNIEISNQKSKTEISGNITTQAGNIDITSVGLDTTEDSIITTNKGDITIQNVPYYDAQTDTSQNGTMNLLGDIRDFDGIINIDSYGDAVVGGYITDEKGYVIIRNLRGDMTVSADVNLNYLNNEEEGFISIGSLSSGKKLDITGNIINWGEGHTNQSGTNAITIMNTSSSSDGVTISGTLSARTGAVNVENQYGKLTTTNDAVISNTEKGAINIINTGKNGAEIRGNIVAKEGNIGITNTKNDLFVNAEITERKGNINITNSGTTLTYLGNTLNEFGDTKVVNNGTGIAQIGASIDNTGNVTINNNKGENLVFSGEINNFGNTSITNSKGVLHINGDITNEHGSTMIQNEGVSAEITSKINNDTGSIAISNKDGHLRITDTAEINNTSDRENSNITIVNYGEDTTIPSNLMIAGNINSNNKGYISIINNGDEANLSGDIFAKDGNVGVTNSNDGKLSFTGNIVDYKGDVTLINNGGDGAEIGGTILDEQGDISIINHGGDLKVTSEITHNYLNRDAQGMISITNSSNAGKVEINSTIATDGAGKTDDDGKTTAILIDNQSDTNGMSISSEITARIGDIIIQNANDNLSTAGMISNYEKGGVSITNSGLDYTNTASILVKEGDVAITNNGTNDVGKLLLGGSINNQKGNTTVSNKGAITEVSGTIDNVGGNTTITNTNGLTRIVGDVTNKGGDISVINSGDFTEITSAIDNEAGSIHISNSKGNLNITNTAKITNTTENEDDSITIANAGGILNLKGGVESTDKGDIEITNTGNGKANIESNVVANEGDIDISNSNAGELNISGSVIDYNGNIDVTNASTDGTTIASTGKITNVKGDTTITNDKGDLTVQQGAQIVNTESGNIVAENKGGKFTISGLFKHAEIGNITVKNSGNKELDITSTGQVLAANGNINIQNSNDGAMNIAGHITDENGKIDIINSSKDGAEISGTILDKEGDTTIFNAGGALDISGNVVDNIGDIKVVNNGADGTSISGTIHALDGDTTVYNTKGELGISGYVVDDKGKLGITNTSDKQTTISGTVLDKEGDTTIFTNGGLTVTDNGYVVDNKGKLDITNKGGDGIDIQGTVLAKDGDATLYNDAGKLDVSGNVVDYKGDLKLINHGADGTNISGVVLAKDGDTTVYNTKGGLDISGNVVDNKGNLDITNNGEDKASISGIVLAKEGDINVYNSNDGALEISGTVKDENGKISITNDSKDGTLISGNVTNVKDDTKITNNDGDLTITETGKVTNTEGGDIDVENNGAKFTIAGLIKHIGDAIGNIFVNNKGDKELEVATTGRIETSNGNIDIENSNDGGIVVAGFVGTDKGVTGINNTSQDGINITTSGVVNNKDGNIEISNTGANGIDIQGSVKTDKQDIKITNKDSDIRIGEYDSDNDNYINAVAGNVVINQTSGNILNNITDPTSTNTHQNHDLGNPDHAYKTLIAAGNNLTINAKDGDIGSTSHANPGFSINADTRDYTESINVNVGGDLVAKATNENETDSRLVNIRAKDSDLKVKDVTSDGNVMLTAADWKQADTRQTPKNDESYFKGYSILNTADIDDASVSGQMISVIASDNIGSADKKFIYNQDTASNPKSSVSFEAENDINLTGRANSSNETKIYQLVSKHGDIDFDMESDAVIKEITAGKGLRLTQKAQNLTIYNLGTSYSSAGQTGEKFDDMLYPHDDIVYGDSSDKSGESAIPNYAIIRVLDAMDTPNRGDSNLKIYSAYVRGNHGENTQYYPDGSRLADYTLMADNIYANSDKAFDSTVSTKENPNGYKQTDKSYDLSGFGIEDGKKYSAQGLNAYGKGDTLSLDVLGVDSDVVNEIVKNPQRNSYNEQKSVDNVPDKFKNDQNRLPFYGYDFRTDNAVISVNDYAPENRGVSFDTLYANNAYINTNDTNLGVQDGYINNYAELRNRDKIAVVDNDYRRIVRPADIQLYTEKTGSFALDLGESINMHTTAPTVYNNPHMLVNGYHSAWNFVNREFKENKDLIDRIDESTALDERRYDESLKRISMRFDTTEDDGLQSNVEIYDISTTGALIRNDKKLKRGKKTTINLKFDDVDITVTAKVVNTKGNMAGIEFVDMPDDVANKILYRYMQQADSMKSNLTTSSI